MVDYKNLSQFKFIKYIAAFRVNYVKKLFAHRFVKNVVTVASGTVVSQAITMAVTPLITRQYSPNDFGALGVFLSISGIMGSVAGLTYPVAIVVPEKDVDALGLAHLSIYVGVLLSLLCLIILFFFGPEIMALLGANDIVEFKYFVPFAMFVGTLFSVLSQWLIRKKAFKLIAKVSVLQSILINGLKVFFGFNNPSAFMLILINSVSGLFGGIMMLLGFLGFEKKEADEFRANIRIKEMGEIMLRYRDFPLLRAPQNLINAFSQNLPVILLAIYFGSASVGFYSIANGVLAMPILLIGGSVMQVFYPQVNDAIHNGLNVKRLIIKTTVGLVISGILPFIIVIVAGPFLFSFVFGEAWRNAGVYAQWLSVWLFFQFINKPAVSAIPALRLQKGFLIYEIISAGVKGFGLYIGFVVFKSDIIAIALFSVIGSISYLYLILWVIYSSEKLKNNKYLGYL